MIKQSASMLLLLTSMAMTSVYGASTRLDLLGDPAPASAAQRTIVITPDTRHVNVEGGEIVNFVVGDKAFAWSFFVGLTVNSFDLNLVAPPGMLKRRVTAYISPDPRYWGKD